MAAGGRGVRGGGRAVEHAAGRRAGVRILGPLFYLLAYRWFGLTVGLVVAAATMAPSILWWGHLVSVLLALGHVLAVHRFARGQKSFASVTFFYQATIGVAAALALV